MKAFLPIQSRPTLGVALLALVLTISAFSYHFSRGHTLALYDAKAHLHIAKQVTDGLTPGFAQLGGVWLPVFHLLMVPTVLYQKSDSRKKWFGSVGSTTSVIWGISALATSYPSFVG